MVCEWFQGACPVYLHVQRWQIGGVRGTGGWLNVECDQHINPLICDARYYSNDVANVRQIDVVISEPPLFYIHVCSAN